MTDLQATNPRFSALDDSMIDLEYKHPDFGWIPFTASPVDPEKLGRELFTAAKRGEFGPVKPYEEPEPEEPSIPYAITRRQGRKALLQIGELDNVENYIASIEDPTERKNAQIEYETDTWEFDNPFLRDTWAQLGGTFEQLGQLFILASTL